MSQLRPGIAAAIHGLKGAPELNGQTATLKEWDADKARWVIQLPGGALKNVKAENLQVASPSSASQNSTISSWVVGAAFIALVAVTVLQQGAGEMGSAKSPTKYVTELFEPFDPPPPKAPKDTVVISFCQG